MLADRLDKAWNAWLRSNAIDPVMRFADQGLILGAGAVLASSVVGDRHLWFDLAEPRVQALLTAAHLSQPTADALVHLRKAVNRWNDGDAAMAAMHLALSRLDRLARPESDAYRIFLADGLLKEGVEAETIIAAIESGDTVLGRIRKYDPNQPRVPAGSGRASGEWTSGGSDASSAQQVPAPSHTLTSRPLVNPDTITPVVGSISACDEAEEDCLRAADYAARNDAANDNSRFIDTVKCKMAGFACDTMSWTTEDVPFVADAGQGGAILFPHNGIVLILKGRLDRYYPPLPGGRRPSFKRGAGLDSEPDRRERLEVGGYSWPPWKLGADEHIVPHPSGFSGLRKVIAIFAGKMEATVTEPTCSFSARWGKVIRAKISYTVDGSAGTALLICVSGEGPGIGLAMRLDNC
jgi:hypothetical protein